MQLQWRIDLELRNYQTRLETLKKAEISLLRPQRKKKREIYWSHIYLRVLMIIGMKLLSDWM